MDYDKLEQEINAERKIMWNKMKKTHAWQNRSRSNARAHPHPHHGHQRTPSEPTRSMYSNKVSIITTKENQTRTTTTVSLLVIFVLLIYVWIHCQFFYHFSSTFTHGLLKNQNRTSSSSKITSPNRNLAHPPLPPPSLLLPLSLLVQSHPLFLLPPQPLLMVQPTIRITMERSRNFLHWRELARVQMRTEMQVCPCMYINNNCKSIILLLLLDYSY